MTRLAIVGAGMAGLAAAYGLRTLPIEVTVFEKSKGYGGRAATRGRHGCRYDHGASYFTASTDRLERLITAHLPTDGLLKIGRSIWGFDQNGEFQRPNATDDVEPKWTYRQGISHLGKLLAWTSSAEIRLEAPVHHLEFSDGVWTVLTSDGSKEPNFDGVLLTPPAPQTAEILAESDVQGEQIHRIQRAIDAVSYTSQFSYIFGYDRQLSRPGEFYALSSVDGEDPLQWIGYEHLKPGHVQLGHSVLVVQTAPFWTANRVDDDPADYVHEVLEMTEDVLVSDLRHPAWFDVQRWRYARPKESVYGKIGTESTDYGLFLGGDAIFGEGRVEAALRSGFRAASGIRDWCEDG